MSLHGHNEIGTCTYLFSGYTVFNFSFNFYYSIAHIVQTQKSQSEGLIGPVV